MVRALDFSLMCRLCAKTYRVEKLVKIFSTRGTSLNLKTCINTHLPIRVTEKDNLPLNICIMCLRKVNATNEFFDIVTTSSKLFDKLLQKKENKRSVQSKEQIQSNIVARRVKNVDERKRIYTENSVDNIQGTKCFSKSNYVQGSSKEITDLLSDKVKENKMNCKNIVPCSSTENEIVTNVTNVIYTTEDLSERRTKNLKSLIQDDKVYKGIINTQCVVSRAMHDGTNYTCNKQNNSVITSKSNDSMLNSSSNATENSHVNTFEANSILTCYKDNGTECNNSNSPISNDIKIHGKFVPAKNSLCNSESMFIPKRSNSLVLDQTINVKFNDTSEKIYQEQSPPCNNLNKNECVIVQEPNNILSSGNNDITFDGSNIVIGVMSNVGVTPKNPVKIPIEVLRCPDCDESVKVFSLEERRLFYTYLKQHLCKKIYKTESDFCKYENKAVVETFAEYKEKYEIKKRKRERNRDIGGIVKSCTRVWPAGDLPADPGPDPAFQEDIFENNVRLDDDFHWPMPKRNRRLHRCNSCDFITKSAVRLRSHQKLHRLDNRQNSHSTGCLYCYKQFETSVEARKHEKLIHIAVGAKNSLCEYCGLMKPQKKLRDHILKQHTVESEIEMLECEVCGKLCISSTSLYLHKKIHATDQQHLCDLCGKAFQQRIALRRHYLLHFPRAPPKFTCDICNKKVTTRGSLRLHMMRHTGEKPQKCPECHVVMRHGLKHHMRLHSDEAPFKCVVCDVNFKRRDYIRRHMRKHLNDRLHRTFHCNICHYAFDEIKNFLIHHRDVHCNEIFTQMKSYDCKNCRMQFTDSSRCKNHEEVCNDLQQNARDSKLYTSVDHTVSNNYSKTCFIGDVQKNCEATISDTYIDKTSTSYTDCTYSSETCQNNPCTIHDVRSGVSDVKKLTVESNDKISNSCNLRFSQNRNKSVQEVRKTKKSGEIISHGAEQTNVILSEQVMSLDAETGYACMNIGKQVRGKDELLMVDEMIVNNSVHGYVSNIESLTNSPHQQIQTQVCLPHLSNTAYTSESLSWKQL